jgi:hypothetical protein
LVGLAAERAHHTNNNGKYLSLKAGLLFCIFDDEKIQRSLQIFDISFAVFNNIFFLQIYCSVAY